MSTNDEIKDQIALLVKKRKLHHLPSMLLGEERVRDIFVSSEVLYAVDGPFEDNRDGDRLYEFRAQLDAFTEGQFISVSESPRGKRWDAMLARVEPVGDEIWDLRCVAPEPGIRCLGAFAGQDTFVALIWDYRENIGIGDFDNFVDMAKTIWRELFGDIDRFKGGHLNDYLSGNYGLC